MDSMFTLTTTKQHLCWSVPISDRAGSQPHRLFEQCNHCRQDVDLLLQSCIQATDELMSSARFFSPAKTSHHKIENEIHGSLCQVVEQSMRIGTSMSWSGLLQCIHPVSDHIFIVMVKGSYITMMRVCTKCNMFRICWPRIVWKGRPVHPCMVYYAVKTTCSQQVVWLPACCLSFTP